MFVLCQNSINTPKIFFKYLYIYLSTNVFISRDACQYLSSYLSTCHAEFDESGGICGLKVWPSTLRDTKYSLAFINQKFAHCLFSSTSLLGSLITAQFYICRWKNGLHKKGKIKCLPVLFQLLSFHILFHIGQINFVFAFQLKRQLLFVFSFYDGFFFR